MSFLKLSELDTVVDVVNSLFSDFDLRNRLLEFFGKYKGKHWIYPDVFVREMGMRRDDVLRLMNRLVDEDVLSLYYSYSCPRCNCVVGNVRSLDNLPDIVFCTHCDTEFEPSNTSIVYRVN